MGKGSCPIYPDEDIADVNPALDHDPGMPKVGINPLFSCHLHRETLNTEYRIACIDSGCNLEENASWNAMTLQDQTKLKTNTWTHDGESL